MPTRARPNVAAGSSPTTRQKASTTVFSSPGGNKTASTKAKRTVGNAQQVENPNGEMSRRERSSSILR